MVASASLNSILAITKIAFTELATRSTSPKQNVTVFPVTAERGNGGRKIREPEH